MTNTASGLAAFLFAAAVAAQSPEQAPEPGAKPAKPLEEIVVEIVCVADGTPVSRVVGKDLPPELARARRWQGRRIAWLVQGKKIEAVDALQLDLDRIARDPTLQRDRRDEQGEKEVLPMRVVPGPGSRWADVLRMWDAAMEAGFREVWFEGVPTSHILPKSVRKPVLGDGELVVPRVVFNEPDDLPPPVRPVFDVHQDGRIERNGATLFERHAGKPDDLEPLRAACRRLQASLAKQGQWLPRPSDQREALDVPLMVRADVWAEWRDVQRLLAVVTDPKVGFWKLEFAVAEEDCEARLQKTGAPELPGKR